MKYNQYDQGSKKKSKEIKLTIGADFQYTYLDLISSRINVFIQPNFETIRRRLKNSATKSEFDKRSDSIRHLFEIIVWYEYELTIN